MVNHHQSMLVAKPDRQMLLLCCHHVSDTIHAAATQLVLSGSSQLFLLETPMHACPCYTVRAAVLICAGWKKCFADGSVTYPILSNRKQNALHLNGLAYDPVKESTDLFFFFPKKITGTNCPEWFCKSSVCILIDMQIRLHILSICFTLTCHS